jgi:transmembrane sensor
MMEKMENMGNHDRELVTRFLTGETNERESAEMEALLAEPGIQGKALREEVEQGRKLLQHVDTFYRMKRFNSSKAWQNVQAQTTSQRGKTVRLNRNRKEVIAKFYKYAAVLVVALLLGTIGYYIGFRNQVPAVYTEIISADRQVLNEYVLPDGSVVTLNSNSKLTFPRKFRGDIREVTIVGEAYFDVTPNPEKPFVIHAGNAQVKVLGTSFNVSAYPENETVEVIVTTGKVQVTGNTDEKTEMKAVLLTPGEKGTLFNQNRMLEKSVNTDPNFLSWKTHDLIFNGVPLSDVIHCLEKTYHIRIDLKGEGLGELLYEGHFDRKPADFVLDVIRLTFDLELTGSDELYTLSGRTNNQ